VAGAVRLHHQPYVIEAQFPIPATVLRAHAKWWFGREPWRVVRYDREEQVFTREIAPNVWIAVALLMLGALPALLYLLLARGNQVVRIAATPAGDHAYLVVQVRPQGNDGRRIAGRFINSAIDHAAAAGINTEA
jgi:hypothetical protein